jgi:hypothetical protein
MLLAFAASVSKPKAWSIDQKGHLTLAIARQPTPNELAVLEVKIGPVGRDTRIVVRSMDKKVLGVIAPYGKLPNSRPSVFSVPVPKKLLTDKNVSLLLEVTEKGSKTARPPLQAEIEDVKLQFLKSSERPVSQ